MRLLIPHITATMNDATSARRSLLRKAHVLWPKQFSLDVAMIHDRNRVRLDVDEASIHPLLIFAYFFRKAEAVANRMDAENNGYASDSQCSYACQRHPYASLSKERVARITRPCAVYHDEGKEAQKRLVRRRAFSM